MFLSKANASANTRVGIVGSAELGGCRVADVQLEWLSAHGHRTDQPRASVGTREVVLNREHASMRLIV